MAKYKVQRKSNRKIIKKNMSYDEACALVKKLESENPNDDFWVVVNG